MHEHLYSRLHRASITLNGDWRSDGQRSMAKARAEGERADRRFRM